MTKVTLERNNITGPAQDNDKILNTLRTEPKLTVVWKRAHRLCVVISGSCGLMFWMED